MNTFKARVLPIFMFVCLLAGFPVSSAQARGPMIIYVNQAARGLNNGTSWRDAYTDLQSALVTAPKIAEIWVAKGTYKPITGYGRSISFQLKNGVAIYGGFAGGETSRKYRDPVANVTILSGDIGQAKFMNDNSYHVVISRMTNSTAILDGFTIAHGLATGSDSDSFGGGMYNSGGSTLANITFSDNSAISGGGMYNLGSPTLTNVVFIRNTTYDDGGGMFNLNSSPTLTNVTFSGNSAPNGGGGMHNDSSDPTLRNVTFNNNFANDNGGGMYNTASHPTLIDVTFSNNATDGGGGGMTNYNDSTPTLTDVTFSNNSAYFGGGIYDLDSSPTLTSVTFSGNSTISYGGGIYDSDGSSPTLTNVAFIGNSAGSNGGGMLTGAGATLTDVTFRNNSSASAGGGLYNFGDSTLTNVTFSNNTAERGGGMVNLGNPTLTNVTFSGNSASNSGGGMTNSPAGTPTLTNVTFSGNSAVNEGGALRSDGNPVFYNAILWGNTAPNGPQIFDNGGQVGCHHVSINDSVVQGGCPAGSICTDIITTDPLLGTLGDHGGSTQTIPLDPGSSAIDTGDDSVCPATDQRGVARPQGGHCDIGAYEVELLVVGPGTYDDTDPAWSYVGNWTLYPGSGPYNNTSHYTSTVGNSATVAFQGTQFSLLYARDPAYGSIDVYVDEVYVETVSAYSSSTLFQQTYTSPVYAAGIHTVRFVHAGGGTYIDVDAITILP